MIHIELVKNGKIEQLITIIREQAKSEEKICFNSLHSVVDHIRSHKVKSMEDYIKKANLAIEYGTALYDLNQNLDGSLNLDKLRCGFDLKFEYGSSKAFLFVKNNSVILKSFIP